MCDDPDPHPTSFDPLAPGDFAIPDRTARQTIGALASRQRLRKEGYTLR